MMKRYVENKQTARRRRILKRGRPPLPALVLACAATLWMSCMPAIPYPGVHLDRIKLPAGFAIEVYTAETPGARSMALSPDGTLFVGTRDQGRVYVLPDKNRDKKPDGVFILGEDLDSPNGVAYRDGALYVAEISRVIRYDNIDAFPGKTPAPVVVNDSFPTDPHHGWKYIAIGPDAKLYVPVGAPCNVCEREDERFASIMRMDLDGKNLEIFARGVRNTVGFDWHPETGVFWFTNNGRDWMGDDMPPDTLHRAPAPGRHFGFPYCHAGDIPDPEYGGEGACADYAPPALKLGPHVAALGMTFYTGAMFPEIWRSRIFIAEHGSWNRSDPIGYRITAATVENGVAKDYSVFAHGWLKGKSAWGRPVDVIEMDDGSLLVSDDRAGAVYRIFYTGGGS